MKESLSPIDANFLAIESPTTHQTIAFYFKLQTSVSSNLIIDKLDELTKNFTRLKDKVVRKKHFFWQIDSNFKLSNHFSEVTQLERESKDVTSELFSIPLDFESPLWKCYSIKAKDGNFFLFKMHHALGDGYAAIKLIYFLTDHTLPIARNNQKRKDGSNLLNKYSSLYRLFREGKGEIYKNLLNGETSETRTVTTIELDMQKLVSVIKKHRGTMNDLFLTLVTLSVSDYHLNNFDIKFSRALIPFNLRKNYDNNTLGNVLTGVGFKLPHYLKSPLEILKYLSKYSYSIKTKGVFGAYKLLGDINARLPFFISRYLSNIAASKINYICTNVPIAKEQISLCGSSVENVYGLAALMKYQGAAFAFTPYLDKANICIVTDPNIVKDPERLANSFKIRLDEMI